MFTIHIEELICDYYLYNYKSGKENNLISNEINMISSQKKSPFHNNWLIFMTDQNLLTVDDLKWLMVITAYLDLQLFIAIWPRVRFIDNHQ